METIVTRVNLINYIKECKKVNIPNRNKFLLYISELYKAIERSEEGMVYEENEQWISEIGKDKNLVKDINERFGYNIYKDVVTDIDSINERLNELTDEIDNASYSSDDSILKEYNCESYQKLYNEFIEKTEVLFNEIIEVNKKIDRMKKEYEDITGENKEEEEVKEVDEVKVNKGENKENNLVKDEDEEVKEVDSEIDDENEDDEDYEGDEDDETIEDELEDGSDDENNDIKTSREQVDFRNQFLPKINKFDKSKSEKSELKEKNSSFVIMAFNISDKNEENKQDAVKKAGLLAGSEQNKDSHDIDINKKNALLNHFKKFPFIYEEDLVKFGKINEKKSGLFSKVYVCQGIELKKKGNKYFMSK
ncbi:MAG: hypothetical protein KatS3mg096_619 [Candidatus Parcubacteria bacterium]|nr:MAG: hypothetical protein KatS3mg096_619 [Candidatus Parcubacteria bacterium]